MNKLFSTAALLLLAVGVTAQTQKLGGSVTGTIETIGALKSDSVFVLPKQTTLHVNKNKGVDTINGCMVWFIGDSGLYMLRGGNYFKLLSKKDSGTVYVDVGEVGHAYGVASLNSSGIVPSSQLPAITINGQVYIDTSQAQMLAHSSATAGALSVRSDSSNQLYVLTQTPPAVRANWHITQGNGVSTFNSRTGAVIPTAGDYNTDIVAEGSTNLYYTNARAHVAIGADTTAGKLATVKRVNDTAAAIRAAMAAISGMAIGGTVSGATHSYILFNKGTTLGQDANFRFDTLTGNKRLKIYDGSGNVVGSFGQYAGVGSAMVLNSPAGTSNVSLVNYWDNSDALLIFTNASNTTQMHPNLSGGVHDIYIPAKNGTLAITTDISDLATTWVKIATKTYSDFSIASTTRTINTGYTLPAKTAICGYIIVPTVAFTGTPSIASYNIGLGGSVSGSNNIMPPLRSVIAAVPGVNTGLALESVSVGSNVTLTATCSSALNTATAGSVDIYLLLGKLP